VFVQQGEQAFWLLPEAATILKYDC